MVEYEVLPNISNFILSLRDIGYSLNTAVADIIDNSITANAKNIKIFSHDNPIFLCIMDDGQGMSSDVLIGALRLGAKSPALKRQALDLGRFGLGLKTASFSQCKRLTVFSKNLDGICGYTWDLDYIQQQDKWLLMEANIDCYKNDEWYNEFISQQSGTVVVWENIDRIEGNNFAEALTVLYDHLALVFHRFIEGDIKGHKLNIFLNNRKIAPFNPFFLESDFTQKKLTEKQFINNECISITPYILPHHSKVTQKEYDLYATRDGYQKSQGFYLYREGRLLIWGTWFGLHKQCEAHKLVRIKIDINNKIDDLWKIDVKKSIASPAPQIKDCLKRIIKEFTEQGFRVYQQRGTIVSRKGSRVKFWDIKHSNGQIKYILNKEHPSYLVLRNSLDEEALHLLEDYLQFVEEYIPIDSIVAKMMDNPKEIKQSDLEIKEQDVIDYIKRLQDLNIPNDTIFSILKEIDAYKDYIDFITNYIYGNDCNE